MNKNLKKICSFVIALMLVLPMCFSTAFAADLHDDPDNVIQPNVVPECGSYATHDMLSAGWGDIYDVNKGYYVVTWGACFQCTRCHLVLVCQNEPDNSVACGYWTTYQPGEPLTSQYTVIYQSTNNILYESSDSIYGCTFRYYQK